MVYQQDPMQLAPGFRPSPGSGSFSGPNPLAQTTLRPGQNLGRYTLLTPVGQGGMATVWAARQVGMHGFQKIVAIKTIMPHLAANPEFVQMFLDEARIASSIHHPNVCAIYDLGEANSVLFLSMEWVDGVSLLALLKARPRTPLQDAIAVRILSEACAGIQAAHELRDDNGYLLNLVHRDVSPHNILLSINGQVKVADFGVAKAMGLDHAPTVAGQIKGKIAYMSPEQANGESSVDRRSDVFSLGAVLYETLTGHRAWAGANDVARLQNLLTGNIIPPRQFRPDLPQELENILAYALNYDPAKRFQTAEQMRLALEQFLVSRGTLVSESNIANVVRLTCGREIEERKAQIRHAAARITEEQAMMEHAGQLGAHGGKRKGMPRATATAITFVAGGITVAGLIGILALGTMPPPARATATPPVPAPTPIPHNYVMIDPEPAYAEVLVNDISIGSGKRTIELAEAGKSHKVVVRAPGYNTATFTIPADTDKNVFRVPLGRAPTPSASSSK